MWSIIVDQKGKPMEMKIVSVTQLKPKLLKVISRAQKLGQEYVVTRNGRPAAVILGYEEWESWRETLEILVDEKAMRRIRRGIAGLRLPPRATWSRIYRRPRFAGG